MPSAGDRLRVTQFVRGTREEVYRAFSDPRLARKWAPDGCRAVHQWKEEDPVETRVRVEFKDRKGGTEVVLTQKGFREASEARGHKKGLVECPQELRQGVCGRRRARAAEMSRPHRDRRESPAPGGRGMSIAWAAQTFGSSLPMPRSRRRCTASVCSKSSSSNSWRTSISPSLPWIAGLGKRLVHSRASSRDFTRMRV
jgi:uncharacterized protein YndB with AHSA1/START domain